MTQRTMGVLVAVLLASVGLDAQAVPFTWKAGVGLRVMQESGSVKRVGVEITINDAGVSLCPTNEKKDGPCMVKPYAEVERVVAEVREVHDSVASSSLILRGVRPVQTPTKTERWLLVFHADGVTRGFYEVGPFHADVLARAVATLETMSDLRVERVP